MEDKEYITITDDDGKEMKFELLTALESEDGKNQYVIYTDNEEDGEGNVNIFASKSVIVDGNPTLVNLEDEEWDDVKSFLDQVMDSDDEEGE
ncbi:MAG: DUF1292 domain-containing protein [Bacilli bacterium]|nr:DUF1292 domain-containing protein [Bacilli bacterium]